MRFAVPSYLGKKRNLMQINLLAWLQWVTEIYHEFVAYPDNAELGIVLHQIAP